MRIGFIAGALPVLIFLTSAVSFAQATTISISPDPCPASANLAPLESPDFSGADLNSWAALGRDILTYVDIDVAEAVGGEQIFQRYVADPATGEIFGVDIETGALIVLSPPPCAPETATER